MKIINFTFVGLICFSILGCATKSINSTRAQAIQLNKEIPVCRVLFNKKSPSQSKIDNCIYAVNKTSTPQFIDRLLNHKPSVPKETLGKLTNTLTNYDTYTKYIGSLKKLIQAGAPTENVNVPYIWHGNDFACNSVMLILKNNIHLYKDKHALQSKPIGAVPNHTSKKRVTDLSWLANTSDGKSICNGAIKYLVSYNPNLLNKPQGFTPLHSYLGDLNHPQWDIKVAKLLMTKNNVNSHGKEGVTPLHGLLANGRKSKWDLVVLKEILKLGGDVSIKGEAGELNFKTSKRKKVSVKELIMKRPDLIGVLAEK